MTTQQFTDTARIITKNLEGGYFHPVMMQDGRMKYNPIYRYSGETMFGIDRKAGAGLRAFNPGGWDMFWSEIDRSGAARSWKWNYRGGALETKLQDLCAAIMLPVYQSYATSYLTAAAKRIVEADPVLFLHFAYGAWNGPGWFQKYARILNPAVSAGKSVREMQQDAVNFRLNSGNQVIIRSGEKLRAMINKGTLPKIGDTLPIIAALALVFF